MIESVVGRSRECLLVGAVRGVATEVPPLIARLTEFAPASIGLGISPDELSGLAEHFVERAVEPLVSLTQSEAAEVRGLSRFGEVRVPNPSTVGVLAWARSRGTPVAGLDPSDATYADLFAEHISYFELVRRTLRERRLVREPPAAPSPDAYATHWHESLSRGRGSKAFDRARDAEFLDGAQALTDRGGRVALVVDRERYDGVLAGLLARSR
ncbi:MAG: hypothetical protein L3K06_00910 [Thermoplasmata archaeon]|nr:hypothetical protein [Thermoplasmata archaeon]